MDIGLSIPYFEPLSAPQTLAPPYLNGLPQAPFKATHGRVFYDWSLRAMIEQRDTYCVNIFPDGNDFPCTFQNVGGVSYLISTNTTTEKLTCCMFGKPFYPPSPTFLSTNVTAVYVGTEDWDKGTADWSLSYSVHAVPCCAQNPLCFSNPPRCTLAPFLVL